MNEILTGNDKDVTSERKSSVIGNILLAATGLTAVGSVVLATPFLLPAFRKICLPYVPATDQQIKNVFFLLKGRGGRLVDLGSGDGRIVIEAAKRGFTAVGVELNPWLVWLSRFNALRHGQFKHVSFSRRNLWKVDLKHYDNAVIFGVKEMMVPLETKLSKELSPNGVVVACRFPLPSWKWQHCSGSGIDTAWLYLVKDQTCRISAENQALLKHNNIHSK